MIPRPMQGVSQRSGTQQCLSKIRLQVPKAFNTASSSTNRQQLKKEVLASIDSLKRGSLATEEDKQHFEEVIQQLERMNPAPKPLVSPLLSGWWRLVYTTRPQAWFRIATFLQQPTYQLLDVPNLQAVNKALCIEVIAELTPMSVNRVSVQFKKFRMVGLFPVKASARGWLSITYLDENMYICRGNMKGVYVLLRDER